jgi:hypothetical protein
VAGIMSAHSSKGLTSASKLGEKRLRYQVWRGTKRQKDVHLRDINAHPFCSNPEEVGNPRPR